MKNRLLPILILFFFNTSFLAAQDLINKVPQDASLLVTFNNKAFFDNLGIDGLNSTLTKFNFFNKVLGENNSSTISKIQDLGIDFQSKAYLYYRMTDSVNFVSALIPLSNVKQFEAILPKELTIEKVNNLSTLYDKDRNVRMSWDNNTLYIITALNTLAFFENPEVKERYGLQTAYDSYEDDVWVEDTEETLYDENSEIDSTITELEEYLYNEEEEEDEYAIVDSILAQDEYADDYYLVYDSINNYNDSIKTTLLANWLNLEFDNLLSNKYGSYTSKKLKTLSKNTLIDIYSDDINSFTHALYGSPAAGMGYLSSLYSYYLLDGQTTDSFDFGIKSLHGQIDIVDNKFKVYGDITMDQTIAKQYREIYKKGINPKFYTHLSKDVLAFMSFNMNTEAYLKNLPDMVNHYYGKLLPNYTDYIALGMNIFEVVFDDKAISKVFKGDNLLLLNGITKATVNYTDYEYDDEYNYVEVEKTKEETLPQFLWMFSSEDTRIFERLIKIGLRENKLLDFDGFYGVEKKNSSGLEIFIQIKNGIVFVGNDIDKMNAIKNNKIEKPYAPYVSIAKKNSAAFVFNTAQVPNILEELEVPIKGGVRTYVEDLKAYGDISIVSKGMAGNIFKTETTIELPKGKGNALQYILSLFDRL